MIGTQLSILYHRGWDSTSPLDGARHRWWQPTGDLLAQAAQRSAPSASNHENAAQGDRQCAGALLPALRLENTTLRGAESSILALGVSEEMSCHPATGHVSMLQMDSQLLSRLSSVL
jgi:hypothetical protein